MEETEEQRCVGIVLFNEIHTHVIQLLAAIKPTPKWAIKQFRSSPSPLASPKKQVNLYFFIPSSAQLHVFQLQFLSTH